MFCICSSVFVINQRGSKKIEPTWDFMEGCSYDVHNYRFYTSIQRLFMTFNSRVNGGLSYLKDIQPSKQSNKKLTSLRKKPPRVSLSYTEGDAYFLPYSNYHTDLKYKTILKWIYRVFV